MTTSASSSTRTEKSSTSRRTTEKPMSWSLPVETTTVTDWASPPPPPPPPPPSPSRQSVLSTKGYLSSSPPPPSRGPVGHLPGGRAGVVQHGDPEGQHGVDRPAPVDVRPQPDRPGRALAQPEAVHVVELAAGAGAVAVGRVQAGWHHGHLRKEWKVLETFPQGDTN